MAEKVHHASANEFRLYRPEYSGLGGVWAECLPFIRAQKYRAAKRYYKTVRAEVVSAGFPVGSLRAVVSGVGLELAPEEGNGVNKLLFTLPESILAEGFDGRN